MNGTMILAACLVALTGAVRSHSPRDNDDISRGRPSGKSAPKTVLIGKVSFEGKPSPPKDLKIEPSQQKSCQHDGKMDMTDRSLLIARDGGLANVVVTIDVEGMKPSMPKEPVVLDNRGCRFEPHVLVIPVGAQLKFKNSDPTSHNIHTYSKRTSSINKTIPPGSEVAHAIKRSEAFSVQCDIHPWMQGWIFATDAPFSAVTGPDGSFSIDGLPAGDYEAKLWHERLGRLTQSFTITEREPTEVEWNMGQQKKSKKRRRR